MSLRTSSRRARLQLERLERRENPAGNIQTANVGGILTLTGTDQAEEFTVQSGGAGSFVLTGLNGTKIDGVPSLTTGPATTIKMNLLGGADRVTVSAVIMTGALTVNAGDGDNQFTLDNSVGVGVSYAAGEGLDTVLIVSSSLTGSVSVTGGGGGSSVTISQTNVDGAVSCKAGPGSDALMLTASAVDKDVLFDAGAGGSSATVANTAVVGNLTYKATEGADGLTMTNASVGGKAGVVFTGGLGAANLTLSASEVAVGGLTVSGVNNSSTVSHTGSGSLVGGDLKVSNGSVTVTNGAELLARNVAFTAADALSVNTTGAAGEWNVSGNLALAATSPIGQIGGAGVALFDKLSVGGRLTATATRGVTLRVDTGDVTKDVTLTSKTGDASFSQQAGVLTVDGSLRLSAAASANASFNTTATSAAIAKDMTLTSRTASAAANLNAPTMTVSGRTTVKGAAGASLNGTATTALNLKNDVSVAGGYSFGTVYFVAAAAATLKFAGKTTVTGGPAANVLLYGGPAELTGAVSVNSSRGTATLESDGAGAKTFGGAVALKGYATKTKLTTTGPTSFAKTLTATGGAGTDVVETSGLFSVAGDATFSLGEGVNTVTVASTTAATDFAGNLKVTTGNAADVVTLTNVQAAKAVTLTSAAGADQFKIDGASVFTGAFTADAGAGDDTFFIAQTNAGAPVTFGGIVVVKLGAGNDELRMGQPTPEPEVAVFNAAAVIDGGLGYNIYDPEAGQGAAPAMLSLSGFIDPNGP